MRGRIQTGEPERRSDCTQRAVHRSRVDRHAQRLIRAPFSSTVNTHVANRDGSIASSGAMAFQSKSLPELCGPAARRFASSTIAAARLTQTPNCSGRRSTHPRGATSNGSQSGPAAPDEAGVTTTKLPRNRSEEHTSELQSLTNLVCRLLLEKKKK